ncbi:MAG: AMP-binding protein [Cyanobacteria bacterium]|nr:AMP-binding protein [Cyanobacteriota bacterium]
MSQLFAMLKDVVQTSPDKEYIIEEEHRWTYQQFFEKVVQFSSGLAREGIQPGDKVALMFMNQKEFLVSFFAVLHLGGVVVPVNIAMAPEDIIYVLKNSGCRLVLTTEALTPILASVDIPRIVANHTHDESMLSWESTLAMGTSRFAPSFQREPNLLGVLMYTSGTTGKPKGVMLSEENLMENKNGFSAVLNFSNEEKALVALPLFHAFGLMISLYLTRLGGSLVLIPKFTPRKILHALTTEHVTILPLVPTMFNMLLEGALKIGKEPFASLKYCISGGAGLPAELLKRIENALDVVVLEGYGLTETSPVIAVNAPSRGSIPKSVGKPLPNVQLRLMDDHGQVIPWQMGNESGEGEIWVKGPNVMMGYYLLPDETQKVLNAEGWFQTGDLGKLDAEGNLFISGGRKKDLIIKAGENIAPVKIEEVLYQHPAVQEASVIGVIDDKVGEDILACVQLKSGESASESDIKKFCRGILPAFMVPSAVRFYEELPKNQTGKIMKNQLKAENPTMPVKSLSATE